MNQYTLYLALRLGTRAAEGPQQPSFALSELRGDGGEGGGGGCKRKRVEFDDEEPETRRNAATSKAATSRALKKPRREGGGSLNNNSNNDNADNGRRGEIDQVIAQIQELKRKALLLGAKVPSSSICAEPF